MFFFFVSLSLSRGEVTGYLSFKYVKGQEQSEVEHGTFKNARLGIIISGRISEEFDYVAEAIIEEKEVNVLQSRVRFKPSEALTFSFGLYLVPFGRYNQFSRAHQTLLVNLPFNIEEIYPFFWRDIGILFEGEFGSLFCSAYLGNGLAEKETLRSAQQFEDNNKNKAKGGRIGLSLSRELSVAYSYYKGKYDKANSRELTLRSADAIWQTRSFMIQSEYTWANLDNPEPFSSGEAEGYFIQFSFDMDNFRPVASYQYLKFRDPFHGFGFISPSYQGRGISEEKSRWAVGFIYFPQERVLFKLEYDFNQEKGSEIKNNVLSLQVALSF